jgi:hypothetical protein
MDVEDSLSYKFIDCPIGEQDIKQVAIPIRLER